VTKSIVGKVGPTLRTGLLPSKSTNQHFEIAILFIIVQRSNIYGFSDAMTLYNPWGKGCTLYWCRTYRYHAYRYGCIVIWRFGIGYILEKFLVAQMQLYTQFLMLIYTSFFPINATISKFQMALKNCVLGAFSQVEKLGLLGYQSFLEWRLMAFLLLIFM
jgi:hypothetical protein